MCWQLAKLASLNIDRSDVPKDRAFTSLRLVRAKMAAKMTAKMAAKMTAKMAECVRMGVCGPLGPQGRDHHSHLKYRGD